MMATFDVSTTNIFKEKLSFGLLYDTVGGVKSPRIPDSEFSVGGLAFNMVAHRLDDPDFPYGVSLKLNEESEKTLANGFEIAVKKYAMTCVTKEGKTGSLQAQPFFFPMDEPAILSFKKAIDHFDVDLEMEFHDIFPHRLQFVDQEVALKNVADCKIILMDDGDKEVFVHKQVLSLRSPFFHYLFYGDVKTMNLHVMQLMGVTQTDFLEYLYRAYPEPIRPLAFKRIDTLLTLAYRCQNAQLMLSIGQFLLEKKNKTAKERRETLIWADIYNMPRLFNETLQMTTKADLKKLDAETCKNFKKENLELLVARLLVLN